MAFVFNGTTIKKVIFNGVDLSFLYHNGVKVFTKFEGLWNGVASFVGSNDLGFVTGLNTNTLVVHYVQSGSGTVTVDANGVFSGTSIEDRTNVFDIAIAIRGVAGGIQIGVDYDDGFGLRYSPTLTFNNETGFANALVKEPGGLQYGLEGSGFSLRIWWSISGGTVGAWATVR